LLLLVVVVTMMMLVRWEQTVDAVSRRRVERHGGDARDLRRDTDLGVR